MFALFSSTGSPFRLQMPTAQGFIRTAFGTGSKFSSSFVVDGLNYTFSGTLSPAVQEFMCSNATLTYTSVSQLTASRSFGGRVGTTDVNLVLDNGPTIVGPLDMPISPASSLSGSGIWGQA